MKKGFTLIELLAVIVILAIIALIATPIVVNIISNSKESTMLRSAEMYLDAVEYGIADTIMNNKNIASGSHTIMENGNICIGTYSNKTCTGDIIEVEVNGEVPEEGSTITIEEGKIKDINLLYGDKTIIKDSGGNLVYDTDEIGKKLDDICEYQKSQSAEKRVGAKYTCNLGSDSRNFYILELGTNPVSNSTLKQDEVALILEGNYDTTAQIWCDQNGTNSNNNVCAADGLTAKLDEISRVWTKLKRNQIVLPSAEQIMKADGKSENSYTELPTLSRSWLYDWPGNDTYNEGGSPFGYFTSTRDVDNSYLVWIVSFAGRLNTDLVDTMEGRGVRPVIILKL